ncbi:MAG: hypothetical protein Q4F17_05265 [Eubacteriales bacterium]|nr:hypothetical protein [Eubacteriales bacterium]
MKQMKNRRFRVLAVGVVCACLIGSLLPMTARAEEVPACSLDTCPGAQCTVEGCLCTCHGEVKSEPVVVESTTETTAPAPAQSAGPTNPTTAPDGTVPAKTEGDEQPTQAPTEPVKTEGPTEPTTEVPAVPTTEAPTDPTKPEDTTPVTEATDPTQATDPKTGITVTWQNQAGEVIATVEKEAGYVLTQEDFPELSQVGWYAVNEEGQLTETPVKADTALTQSVTLRAVERSVSLSLSGECVVGSQVTLTATLTGFAGEQLSIQWQNCPIDAEGNPTGEWTTVEGATDTSYVYTIPENAQSLSWQVVVTVQ